MGSMSSPDLAAIRREYTGRGLSEDEAGDDPLVLLRTWLAEAVAAGIDEPNAMALATADSRGRPSVRTVLLKGLDIDGAVFYTNLDSRKGRDLAENPWAAAVLLWRPLQRQVRIDGPALPVTNDEADRYFESRPRGAQIGAVASQQSEPIEDRDALERRYAEVDLANPVPGTIARPPSGAATDWVSTRSSSGRGGPTGCTIASDSSGKCPAGSASAYSRSPTHPPASGGDDLRTVDGDGASPSGAFAGPATTDPSAIENLLPWQVQLIVPSATAETRQP